MLEKTSYSGEKIDIFALGVILFLFCAARPPFEEASKDNKWFRYFIEKKAKFWEF